jgi:cytochrome c oxidase subunit II
VSRVAPPLTRRARLLVVALLGLAVGGCVPRPATIEGRAIADLWVVFGVASAAVGLIVWGLVTWSILRYRRRDAVLPVQTHGHLGLEILWTALPIVTVIALFALTYRAIGAVDTPASAARVSVDVVAYTWQWSFHYQGTDVTIVGLPNEEPELVVPVGETVRVNLTSSDVDHSFYVPEFLFKRDAIPGHPTTFDFTVETPGVYPGQCAEFCGLQHDRMRFTVRAVDRGTFDAWLAGAAATSAPATPSPTGSSP